MTSTGTAPDAESLWLQAGGDNLYKSDPVARNYALKITFAWFARGIQIGQQLAEAPDAPVRVRRKTSADLTAEAAQIARGLASGTIQIAPYEPPPPRTSRTPRKAPSSGTSRRS